MVNQQVTGQHRDPPLRTLFGDRFGVPHRERKRLFDEDRLPRLEHLARDGRMGRRRGGDDHGVHRPKQRPQVGSHEGSGVLPGYPFADPGIGVANCCQLAFRQPGDRADVIAPPRTGPYYTDLEPVHR